MAFEKELSVAIAESATFFKGVFDKAGQPYILHKLRVMNSVLPYGYDHAILAVVHDVGEDCFKGRPDDAWEWFSTKITDDASMLRDFQILTHDPRDSYSLYIQGIKAQGERATRVKKADLKDNSDIMRLKGVTDKDIERVRKYHTSYLYLDDRHDKLFDASFTRSST